MILLFSYFYTSIIFNSVDLAENLKKQGAFIPGREAGRRAPPTTSTACWPGSPCPAASSWPSIALAADRRVQAGQHPDVGFGGTSVLIVVGVLLDTIAQVEQHRTLRKYDGFMKTGRVKFRGRQQRYM